MWNAWLDESQDGIKIAERNVNNLRYANGITLMEESEEELKNLLMTVKEKSDKTGLKVNIQKTKIMASGPTTSWQIEGRRVEAVTNFIFLGSKITVDNDCSHDVKRCLLLGRKAVTNLDSVLKSGDNKRSIESKLWSSSHVWMWELDHKKADCRRIDAFKLWS